MAKIFESPRTAKNLENVCWAQSFGICVVYSPKNFGFCSNLLILISISRNFVTFVNYEEQNF